MLNAISWQQYFEALIILLVIYYLYIGLKYYRPNFSRFTNPMAATSSVFTELQYQEPVIEEQDWQDDTTNETEKLIAALKASIKQSPERDAIKKILQQHPNIKNSPLRPAINELIVSEWEKYSAVLLSETEVDQWWD